MDILSHYSWAEGNDINRARGATTRAQFQHDATVAAARAILAIPPAPMPPVTGPWHLVWADEFDGDLSKWNVQNNSTFGSASQEEQTYMAGCVSAAGGSLQLDAGLNIAGKIISGMVTTRVQGGPLKFKFRHGYCEARMRHPLGPPFWGAFWLVGASDGSSPGWPAYGEFDVMEAYGSQTDAAESNFHRTGGNIGGRTHPLATPINEWHTYGLHWTADTLEWWYDGKMVRRYAASSPEDVAALSYEHSIIINLAIGGAGPAYHGYKPPAAPFLPGTLEVDYVRVWQR